VVTVIKAKVTIRLGVFDELYTNISFMFKNNLTLLKTSLMVANQGYKMIKIREFHQFDGWPFVTLSTDGASIIHYNN